MTNNELSSTIATACGSPLMRTMIVVYVLRRTTVHKGYVTPVLLSSVLFVNIVLTHFTWDNGSGKGTGVNKN